MYQVYLSLLSALLCVNWKIMIIIKLQDYNSNDKIANFEKDKFMNNLALIYID